MRLSLFSRVAEWAAINNTTKHEDEVDGHPLVKTYVLLASYLLPHAMEKFIETFWRTTWSSQVPTPN